MVGVGQEIMEGMCGKKHVCGFFFPFENMAGRTLCACDASPSFPPKRYLTRVLRPGFYFGSIWFNTLKSSTRNASFYGTRCVRRASNESQTVRDLCVASQHVIVETWSRRVSMGLSWDLKISGDEPSPHLLRHYPSCGCSMSPKPRKGDCASPFVLCVCVLSDGRQSYPASLRVLSGCG